MVGPFTLLGRTVAEGRLDLAHCELDSTFEESGGAELTDQDLKKLDGVDVETLVLENTGITDEGVWHLKGLIGLRDLNLSRTKVTDNGLAYLRDLIGIVRLALERTMVTDRGLWLLKHLSGLRDLALGHCTGVTGAGLEYLKVLTGLEKLDLGGTKVRCEGLVHLGGLTKLQELGLSDLNVTDADLETLRHLPDLRGLALSGNHMVTDVGLEHLKVLTGLQKLDLRNTGVSDHGLVHLRAFTGLQELDLSNTVVSDSGLLFYLQHLPELKSVSVSGGGVTEAGVKFLRMALPNTEVLR